jgi:hypothetical protein
MARYKISIEEPYGKRTLGRPRRKWVDCIKIDVKKYPVWTVLIWLRIRTRGWLF